MNNRSLVYSNPDPTKFCQPISISDYLNFMVRKREIFDANILKTFQVASEIKRKGTGTWVNFVWTDSYLTVGTMLFNIPKLASLLNPIGSFCPMSSVNCYPHHQLPACQDCSAHCNKKIKQLSHLDEKTISESRLWIMVSHRLFHLYSPSNTPMVRLSNNDLLETSKWAP